MKVILLTVALAIAVMQSFAQVPHKMSYQAVIRNGSDELIANSPIGIKISVLQGAANGSVVYEETQTVNTNANGLLSLEIGSGTIISGDLNTIDWSSDSYFLKTETDVSGGTTYTLSSTSQLMSVPYALHAKTAESVLNPTVETDPVYTNSIASGITAVDTAKWNEETDPIYTNSIASGITAIDTSKWNEETDPVYTNSIASGITAVDTAKWNAETDPVYTNSIASGITAVDTAKWNAETDPVYTNSIAGGITAVDTAEWNKTPKAGKGIDISNDTVSIADGINNSNIKVWNGSTWVNSSISLATIGGSQPISIRDPYLTLHYQIALEGVFPSQNGYDNYLGEIAIYPYYFAVRGWASCNGQLMSISQNTALFALLGTTYGGNGITTFGLPDLRGRSPIHTGQGPGLSTFVLGENGGVENITINQNQMPAHTHQVVFGAP